MANQFFVPTAQYGPGLQSLAKGVQQFGQQRKEEQRLAEAEDYKQRAKQAMAQAFQSGDPAAIRQAVIEFPEIAETATQLFGFTNEQTEKVARETYRRALTETDPARRQAILEGGIETVQQFGGNPRTMTRDLQMLQENPEAAIKSMRGGYAALASDQEYEAVFGGQEQESEFIRDLRAANIDPQSEQGQQLIRERYGKGKTIGYDVIKAKNPETGEMEWAQVSRVNPGEIRFLGAGVPTDLSAVEKVDEAGGFESPSQARRVLSEANSQQAKAGGYAARLAQANAELLELEQSEDIDFSSRALQMAMTPSADGFFGMFEAGFDEVARRNLSPEEQRYLNQATEFVRAALRQESGAVIGADEARDEIKKYFPRPGDDQTTIESKRRLRERKIKELANQSGGTFDAQMYLMQSEQSPTGQQQPREQQRPNEQQGQGETERRSFYDLPSRGGQ